METISSEQFRIGLPKTFQSGNSAKFFYYGYRAALSGELLMNTTGPKLLSSSINVSPKATAWRKFLMHYLLPLQRRSSDIQHGKPSIQTIKGQ